MTSFFIWSNQCDSSPLVNPTIWSSKAPPHAINFFWTTKLGKILPKPQWSVLIFCCFVSMGLCLWVYRVMGIFVFLCTTLVPLFLLIQLPFQNVNTYIYIYIYIIFWGKNPYTNLLRNERSDRCLDKEYATSCKVVQVFLDERTCLNSLNSRHATKPS